jgi:hypothetical protein
MQDGLVAYVTSLEMVPDKFQLQNFKEMEHSKYMNVEGRTLLRQALKKQAIIQAALN